MAQTLAEDTVHNLVFGRFGSAERGKVCAERRVARESSDFLARWLFGGGEL